MGGNDEHGRQEEEASLYRLNTDGDLAKIKDQVSTSNGLDWDRDRNLMYYIDTPTQEIVCYAYDPETGAVSDPKTVYRFPESQGSPDGMTIDRDGMLWVALFGGGRAVRIDPFLHKEIASIEVPAKYVTCSRVRRQRLEHVIHYDRDGKIDGSRKT